MSEQQWHLSKAVPVTIVLAVLAQTVSLIWFVATLSNDVDNNTRSISRLQERSESLADIVHDQEVTLGRIDENIKMLVKRSK